MWCQWMDNTCIKSAGLEVHEGGRRIQFRWKRLINNFLVFEQFKWWVKRKKQQGLGPGWFNQEEFDLFLQQGFEEGTKLKTPLEGTG